MAKAKSLAPVNVESKILEARGERLVRDRDLAETYGVTTRALNQALKRNRDRFPDDFVFQLTIAEAEDILRSRSQSVTMMRGLNIRYRPWAFAEHGAIMAVTVLSRARAVEMSVFVVRAFIRLSQFARGHAEITKRLDAPEQKVAGHDEALKEMFAALRVLLAQPEKPRRGIGFRSRERES